MGAFFTNVQVAIGQRRPADVRDAIVGTLRASVSGAGLVEDAALADEDAARVIYVGPSDADGWISVYDDATEDQDEDRLRALAEALSRAGDAAVNILCHDSDILDMHLCRDGAEVDHYNNFPNYFDDGADERAPAEGDAALWQPVLVPGTTPETLRAAWEVEDVFAEDTLARIAPLFGWDMDRCSVGVRYLPEAEQDLGGYARLVFREAQAQGDASRGQASLVMSGPPRLIPTGGQQAITFAVGAPLAAAVASSGGRPSTTGSSSRAPPG
jgi:hypothetical protein